MGVQQQNAATAATSTDLQHPFQANELRQRPTVTFPPPDGMERITPGTKIDA